MGADNYLRRAIVRGSPESTDNGALCDVKSDEAGGGQAAVAESD